MKLHSEIQVYADAVAFYLVDERDGKRSIAQPIEMGPLPDGLLVQPSFRIPLSNVQEMFEQLWAQGFRSKHDKGNSEALDTARREHIDDLRKAAKLK